MDQHTHPAEVLEKMGNLKLINDNGKHCAQPDHSHARKATVTQVWGPFYVTGAPFRARLSPVWARGEAIAIKGVVYGQDTGKPLPFALLDLWQTSPDAEYDYYEADDEKHPYKEELNTHGKSKEYNYRTRVLADENGRFEYETVKPAPYYDPDDSTWRTSHIHYYVQYPGYKPLITQMYLAGEENNSIDIHIKESLIVRLEEVVHEYKDGEKFKHREGTFDITLEPQ